MTELPLPYKRLYMVHLFLNASLEEVYARLLLRYQGTPNDNLALSQFERQTFHKNPDELYIL